MVFSLSEFVALPPNAQRQPLAEAQPKASRLHAVLGGCAY
jgi:hypothetical protein